MKLPILGWEIDSIFGMKVENLLDQKLIFIYALVLFLLLSLIERLLTRKRDRSFKILTIFFVLTSYVGVLVFVFFAKAYVIDAIDWGINYLKENYDTKWASVIYDTRGLIRFTGLTAMIYLSILVVNAFRSKITKRNLNYDLVRTLFYLTYATMLVYYYIVDPNTTNDIYVVLVIETLLDMLIKINKK